MGPMVTFVIPVYKLAHMLPDCVNSVLKQDYKNFEILIMDNCSPDNTPEVAQSFNDPRVKHVRNETNIGHIRNFNKGIASARGKYVWMLCVDDMLRSPQVLGRYVDLMERNPTVGLVFCRAVDFQGGQEKNITKWADHGGEDRMWKDGSFFHHLIEGNDIAACAFFVRKASYPKGPYQLEIPWASDWYVTCMVALHTDVAYLQEPMVLIRIHGESLTTQCSQDYARLCIGDELAVLRRVGREAELAGMSSQRDACEAALVRRAVHALQAGTNGKTPGMTRADFEIILKERIDSSEERDRIKALVYAALGDEQFWEGEREQAAQSYMLALSASPGHPRTLGKYLLLRTGSVGIRLRKLSRQRRREEFKIKFAK
jgi:hypothetical protein